MPRPVHFEIHTDNPARALAFYQKMFGWEATKYEGSPTEYWLLTTGKDDGHGINGGLMKRNAPAVPQGQSPNAYVCTMDVANLDEMMNKLVQSGGSVAMEKMAIPSMGWLGYGFDTEGNIFGMMQMDVNAK
jgi:predicted enzyme related to lactoylglutathione lyase